MSDNLISLRAQHFTRHWQLWASLHHFLSAALFRELLVARALCVDQAAHEHQADDRNHARGDERGNHANGKGLLALGALLFAPRQQVYARH